MDAVRLVLLQVIKEETEAYPNFLENLEGTVEETDTDELYDYIYEYEGLGALEEFRESGEETNLAPTEYSRNYEVDFVARCIDGPSGPDEDVWVGWNYFYGGGKHGNPGSYEWMKSLVVLDVKSEIVQITKNTFSIAT